jgi:protein TonB
MKTKQKPNILMDAGLPQSLHATQLLKPQKVHATDIQDLITIKKEKSFVDKEQSNLFFFLGLTISLAFIIIAINWKSYDEVNLIDLGQVTTQFEDLLEIPQSEQLPPPPPPADLTPQIVEVANEEIIKDLEVNLDVEMNEDTKIQELNIDFTVEPIEEEKVEEVFTVVENYPKPVGGMSAFYKYVGDEVVYPISARRLGISGIVFVRFVVEKDGKISNVEVARGIGAGCDEEAVRVLNNAPAWEPGNQRGRPVRVFMTVPIRFILRDQG